MPITPTSSITSYPTETANPSPKEWALKGTVKCPYCLNRVKPKSRFNWGIFLLLFISTWIVVEVPAIAYWGLRHGKYKCPNCGLSPLLDRQGQVVWMPENWGQEILARLSLEGLTMLRHQLESVHADLRGISRVNTEIEERRREERRAKIQAQIQAMIDGGLTCRECGSKILSSITKPNRSWVWVCVQGHETTTPNDMSKGAVLVNCPYCHKFVTPDKASSSRPFHGSGLSWGRGGASIGTLRGSSDYEFYRCPNCDLSLGEA